MKYSKAKKMAFANIAWRFAERIGAQGVSFIVGIILARLLAPEAYGTVALVTVFTTILQVFVDSGLGTALIQKKTRMISIFQQCFISILLSAQFCIWGCFFLLQ